MNLDHHIEAIYEAAVVPQLWSRVLDDLSREIGAWGTILISARGLTFTTRASSNPRIEQLSHEYPALYPNNNRAARLIASDHMGFVTEDDLLSPEERFLDESYEEYLIPLGIGRGVATTIAAPSGDTIILHSEYAYDHGPIGRSIVAALDHLRPHFARAALLSSRLGMAQLQGMANVLEAIGIPAAVLRRSGTMLAANPSLQKLVPHVLMDRRERTAFVNPNADGLLAAALTQFRTVGDVMGPASIPIPSHEGRVPMIAHLVPVRGVANDIFNDAGLLLIVTPVDRSSVPSAEVLQGLFDLTPAEAHVARAVASTQSVHDVAMARGVSRETVRSQLKAILEKTGLNRQSELVSLLVGTSPPFRS